MRPLYILAIMLLPNLASAGCDDIAILRTASIYIDISDGGCAHETLISFTTKMMKDGDPDWDSMKTVPFYKECSLNRDRTVFSCKPEGQSPLAGATYKLVEHGELNCDLGSPADGMPGHRWVCIKGCKKSVPTYLVQSEGCG